MPCPPTRGSERYEKKGDAQRCRSNGLENLRRAFPNVINQGHDQPPRQGPTLGRRYRLEGRTAILSAISLSIGPSFVSMAREPFNSKTSSKLIGIQPSLNSL